MDNNTPGTKRRTQAQLADLARKKTRKRIPYDQFVQVCLFHGLEAHQEMLAPYAKELRDMDALRKGTLNESQFRQLCAGVRPDLTEADVEGLLLELDPWNMHAISVSSCYTALVPGLSKLAAGGGTGAGGGGAAGSVAAVGAGGKSLGGGGALKESLGGVGHGELWNVSYEGRNFKGMTR